VLDVDPLAIAQLFERLHDFFVAAGFALARMTGVIMVMPAFTRVGATGMLRPAIALALALPLMPALVQAITGAQLTAMMIVVLLLKEMIVGVVIGIVLGVPFWAAEAAGDVLDLQRGSTAASLIDPLAMTEESITGTLFGLAMVALYFASGGLPLTLRTIYDSYALWPAPALLPIFGASAPQLFVGLLDTIITMGLVLVAPIVVCLLLADLVLALVSRASPHLNVFALVLSVKNLAFAVLLVLYCAFLIDYMGGDLNSLLRAGSDLEAIRAATPP
jgi:type III secretion protein T